MKENDLYIVALKYGYSKLEQGVTHSEVKKYLESKGFSFPTREAEKHYDRIFTSIFSEPQGRSWKNHNVPDSVEFTCFMDSDAYFKLLEYEELKDARKSSLHATVFASIAIVISIFSTLMSIYYSNEQINTPATIEASQFKSINNSETHVLLKDIKSIQKKLLHEAKSIKTNAEEIKTHNKSLNRIGAKNAPPG